MMYPGQSIPTKNQTDDVDCIQEQDSVKKGRMEDQEEMLRRTLHFASLT
jgi:hypothetical protein